MRTSNLLVYAAGQLRHKDRGVFRHGPHLIAFGNRGMDELKPFRAWLRRYGYVEEGFACLDGGYSWVVRLSHPLGEPNAEAVEHGLWVAWAEVAPPVTVIHAADVIAALDLIDPDPCAMKVGAEG